MNVLIIEDDRAYQMEMKMLLRMIDPSIIILDTIASVKDAVMWFNQNPPPDLIMMDIQLEDGVCFEIFENIELNSPIIFTTSRDEYALKAFEMNSIDYIIKPVNKEKLARGIEKYKNIKQTYLQKELLSSLSVAINSFKREDIAYKTRYLVYKGENIIPVDVKEIVYFLSEDKATIIVCKNGERFFVNSSLDEIEREIDPSIFFRANRQYIVSANNIKKISNYFNYKLQLEMTIPAEKEIIVSREKAPDFKKWLDK